MAKMRRSRRTLYDHEMILSRHAAPGPTDLVLILDHLKGGFNVPKIIRSANAMGCRELHFIGIPVFDPGPAKGTLRHTFSRSFETFEESYALLTQQGYSIFALDSQSKSTLGLVQLPQKSAIVVGHEQYGLSFDPLKFEKLKMLRIKQLGAVDSLNVSIAASIACFEYLRQHHLQTEV
jgi:tRNA G18 (ribose-2'-O)-methylase SpoU